jgi:dihydropteroate synthase
VDLNLLLLEGSSAPLSGPEIAALGLSRETPPPGAGWHLARLEGLSAAAEGRVSRTLRECGAEANASGARPGRALLARIPDPALNLLVRRLLREEPPLPRIAGEIRSALRALRHPPAALLLPRRRIPLVRRTLIQGILNVTPDSFFDGGRWSDPGLAVERAFQMAEEGAGMVDVGGESTRPGSRAVSAREEIRRVLPVLSALEGRLPIPISVDTTKPEVAEAALAAGAEAINDVSGLSFAPRLAAVAARHGAGLILSHIQGRPRSMQRNPRYRHLFPEVMAFLRRGIRRALEAGVRPGSIVLDPGIGFGKTLEQNLLILRHLRILRGMGHPVMVGASRKSFLSRIQKDDGPADRLEASLGAAAVAIWNGASLLRAHDVAATVRMARSVEAVRDVRMGAAGE